MLCNMKIAYLILAHAHPRQLGRLAARLAGPGVHLYLHIDANTPPDIYRAMQDSVEQSNLPATWIARQPCRWGGFSLVEATLHLMRAALADGCDWLILLSGQDYPLQAHHVIASRLLRSGMAGFIDMRAQAQFDVRYRFESFHCERLNGKAADRWLQKLQRTLNHMGLRRHLPLPLQQVYAGSQWWMLSAPVCRWLLDFCEAYPRIIPFFRRTLVPDEMFFQTLLAHSAFASQLQADPLRLILWPEGAWSPRTMTEDDIPQLLASSALFARKFAPDGHVSTLLDQSRGITPCSPC